VPVSKRNMGVSGVVAALAIALLALMTSVSIALMMYKPSALTVNALRTDLEKRDELLLIYLYNLSLCELKSKRVAPNNWKVVVYNAGPLEVEVDNLLIVKMLGKVHERKNIRLQPGEYVVIPLGAGDHHDARIYAHTTRGSLFTGGYKIPDPYTLIEIDSNGRCSEP